MAHEAAAAPRAGGARSHANFAGGPKCGNKLIGGNTLPANCSPRGFSVFPTTAILTSWSIIFLVRR